MNSKQERKKNEFIVTTCANENGGLDKTTNKIIREHYIQHYTTSIHPVDYSALYSDFNFPPPRHIYQSNAWGMPAEDVDVYI